MALRLEPPQYAHCMCAVFLLMPVLCSHFTSDLPVCPFFVVLCRWIPRIIFLTSVSILPCDPARCHLPVLCPSCCPSVRPCLPLPHAVPLIPPSVPSCMCHAWCVVGWWWFCLGVLKRCGASTYLEPKCHCLSCNKCLTFVLCGMCLYVFVIMDVSMCIGQSFLSAL